MFLSGMEIDFDLLSPKKHTRARKSESGKQVKPMVVAAFAFGGGPDLLFFHEFPVTGYYHGWNLGDARKVAIELPGPETELLARKAREYGCWLVFGSYVRDPAWPKSLLSITAIMNDKGEIVDRHWKARNLKGFFGGRKELFTTTISYDLGVRTVPSFKTTPEAIDIFGMLAQMRDAGCRQAVMEVSSHGIDQKRVLGMQFDAARDNIPQGDVAFDDDERPGLALGHLHQGQVRLEQELRGYRMADVDALLDRLGAEIQARDEEIDRLRGEGPRPPAPPAD